MILQWVIRKNHPLLGRHGGASSRLARDDLQYKRVEGQILLASFLLFHDWL
jgi:hypothetical protein